MSAPPKPIRWLQPDIVRGVSHWRAACTCTLQSPQALEWNKSHGRGDKCHLSGKIDFRGKIVCMRHAGILALNELLEEQS